MPPQPFVRNRFFDGRLLSAGDLQAEQDYHRGKRRLANRCLHGSGVLCGLDVSLDPSGSAVRLGPGVALDCAGREIVVGEGVSLPLPTGEAALYLLLRYSESLSDPMPSTQTESGAPQFARVLEDFELEWSEADPVQDHRRRKGRWLCCSGEHPLPLARLIAGADGVAVDEQFRAFIDVSRRASYCAS